jgi:hypothetical protein
MKINYDGTFRDISRIIDAPLRPTEKPEPGQQFAKLLSSISPDNQQPANIKVESPIPLPRDDQDDGIRARFNFTPSSLMTPDSEPISVPSGTDQLVNEPVQSVKSPSIVEIRRIAHHASTASIDLSKRIDQVKGLVADAGEKLGIDPALSMAVVEAESGFDSHAVSTDGYKSKGLFQLLDRTGNELLSRAGIKKEYDPFNPNLNVNLGVGYLRYLHDIFSRPTELPNNMTTVAAANSSSLEKLAVAAFNAGEGRVASAQQRAKAAGSSPAEYANVEKYLPENTQEYVARVMQLRADHKSRFGDEIDG